MIVIAIVSVALFCSASAVSVEECEQEEFDLPSLQFLTTEETTGDEVAAKGCCLPGRLEGGLWLKKIVKFNRRSMDDVDTEYEVDKRGRKPIVIDASGNFSVDYGKKRLVVNEVGIVANSKVVFNVSVIQAADIKTVYIIDWNSKKCAVKPFDHGLNQCVNATLLTQSNFGIAGSSRDGLKVNIYGQKFATKEACGGAITIVTAYQCAPFNMAVELRSKRMNVYESITYHDLKTTIKNPTVFNPPSFCRKPSDEADEINIEELPHLIQHFAQ